MTKKIIIILIILLFSTLLFSQRKIIPGKPNKNYIERDKKIKNISNELFGIGPCVGKGAGLFGGYLYFRLLNKFYFELNGGVRYLHISLPNSSLSFWPYMFTGKFQLYFSEYHNQQQHGLEFGVIYAEDMGIGNEIAYIFKYRLSNHLFFSINIGIGFFHNNKKSLYHFLNNKGYKNIYITSYPSNVFYLWGLGINISI